MISAEPSLKTLTGIGTSQIDDSFEAGVEIAKTAIANGELSAHTLFFLFSTELFIIKFLFHFILFL